MSVTFEVNAETRDEQGKGASRRLRHAGLVPGIVYGAGKEPVAITLKHNELIRQLEEEAFYSQVLTLKLGGESEKVVLRDLQRHPAKPLVLHVDLQRINENEKMHVMLPLHYLNEDSCVGVKMEGGLISHIASEVEISCLPKDLPEYLEVDLAELHLGETLHQSDIKLPEGVELVDLAHGHDNAVATVHKTRAVAEETEEVASEGEGEGEETSE
jgi:large subunit ribosomal protein L25